MRVVPRRERAEETGVGLVRMSQSIREATVQPCKHALGGEPARIGIDALKLLKQLCSL